MTWAGIAENLVSDVLFLILSAVLAWAAITFSKRSRLLRFFGANRSRRLVVYMSNLRVVSFGAVGIDGTRRSYEGSAVAFGEMQSANRFRDLFNYIFPSLSDAPGGLLSKLLISDVHVQRLPAPLEEGQLERSASFITLGSPAYNVASKYVEETLHSKARFRLGETGSSTSGQDPDDREESSFIPPAIPPSYQPPYHPTGLDYPSRAPDAGASFSTSPSALSSGVGGSADMFRPRTTAANRGGERIPPEGGQASAIIVEGIPPITDSNYGFIERMIDHDAKRSVFYLAGISELATAGAANYLLSEWASLNRKYGAETGFLVMLRFEPTDFTQWSIVFER